jgi:hypothetical protein
MPSKKPKPKFDVVKFGREMNARILSDPKQLLGVAVHEVGHLALMCANGELPRGISVGGTDVDSLGRTHGGGFEPFDSLEEHVARALPTRDGRSRRKSEVRSSLRRRAVLDAAMCLAGYVAEARHNGTGIWDVLCEAGRDDGDLVRGFAWCAWSVGVGEARAVDLNGVRMPPMWRCDVDAVLVTLLLGRHAPREYRAVRRAVDAAVRLADDYLADQWPLVMRMARTLARREPDDDRRALSEESVYRWAQRFPSASTWRENRGTK